MKCPYCDGRDHYARDTKPDKGPRKSTQYRICRKCLRVFAVDRRVRGLPG